MKGSRRRRNAQRGFALLLVFAMAAAIAVMLYLEMPRVAFEHQRNKEQLLVERGEQYTRAIELYVKKFQKYPQTIEELESTNNLRFLRKRFIDPMTGKEEWRLIHVDNAGQYTDSLVHKKKDQKEESGPSALASKIQGIGENATIIDLPGEKKESPAVQKRASDRIIPGLPGAGGQQQGESGDEGPPEQPPAFPGAAMPGQAGQIAALPGPGGPADAQGLAPGLGRPGPGGSPFLTPQMPQQGQTGGAQQSGSQPGGGGFGMGSSFGGGGTGSSQPQQGAQQGQQGGSSASSPNLGASNPFSPGGSQQGMQGGFGGSQGGTNLNQAAPIIQGIISGQRPNMGGLGGGQQGQGGFAGITGGGIAGVASKLDGEGIRIYNEKTNYKEWEFLFDLKKMMQSMGQGQQQGVNQPNQPGSQQRPQSPGQGGFGGFGQGGSQQRPSGFGRQ
jgi:uncharacterized membrane protein YgcG